MAINQSYYYVLGQLTYSIASFNKQMDQQDKNKLQEILVEETLDDHLDFDYGDVMSFIYRKEERDFKSTYNWALSTFRVDKSLSKKRITRCFTIITKVVTAFPSDLTNRQKFLSKIQEDLNAIT